MDKKTAWNQFCETGSVQDYLGYLKAPEAKRADAGEDTGPYAEHNRCDSNWYNEYR